MSPLPLPPPHLQGAGNLFHKKALDRGKNFLGQIYGGMFYTGTNDQIMQRGKIMGKRFQKSSQVTLFFYRSINSISIPRLKKP